MYNELLRPMKFCEYMCDLVTNAEFRNQNDPNIFNDLLKALKI